MTTCTTQASLHFTLWTHVLCLNSFLCILVNVKFDISAIIIKEQLINTHEIANSSLGLSI